MAAPDASLRSFVLAGSLCAIALLGTAPAAAQMSGLRFADRTVASGLQHALREGAQPLAGLVPFEQSRWGAGAAVADYDRDGDLDVYFLAHHGHPNRLFQNDGAGHFTDVTDVAGGGDLGWGRTALFVDLDGDGWDDLVVVNDCDSDPTFPQTMIYENRAGVFHPRKETGIDTIVRTVGGATAGDYDHDGDIDLFVTSWFDANIYLLRNEGDFTFSDATPFSGLWQLQTLVSHWTPVFVDVDNDGWQDIFCAVDFSDDYLFLNNHDGTFSFHPTLYHQGNDMGVAVGDYDWDGDVDLYTTNITQDTDPFDCCNWLYQNDGSGNFVNVAPRVGVRDTRWGWGTSFFDADLDGDLDLVAVNGWFQPVWTYPAQFFVNERGRFSEQAAHVGLDHVGDSRTVIPFDADGDGDLDILITDVLSKAAYYENLGHSTTSGGQRSRAWLRVRLRGSVSNPNGVGAKVSAITGGVTRTHEIVAGGSFYAGPPLEAHFGLGKAREVTLEIRWPSGIVQTVGPIAPNQVITVVEQ